MHLWNFLNKKIGVGFDENAYRDNYQSIAQSNIRFYELYNDIMIGLVAMLFISTFFSTYALELRYVYVVFFVISVVEIVLIKKGITNTAKMIPYTIYYGIVKTYVFGLLSSVIYNRESYAITFFIFMILVPVSFVLKPITVFWIQTVVSVVFCITTIIFKPFSLAVGDVLACIVFYVISFVIAGQINNLRINNLRLLADEQKQNENLVDQKDLLGVSLEIAKLCNLPEVDFRENMDAIIEKVRQTYDAARAYVFEFDWPNNRMSNTYESIGEDVTAEIQNLQDLPTEIVSYWLPRFRDGKEVFIENLEDIKKDPSRQEEYDILAPQGIKTLAVIPISRNGHLYGYIGVDNPNIRVSEHEFIMNVAMLLSQEYYACDQQNKLFEISMKDSLTELDNRHSYELYLEKANKKTLDNVGVLFADVNGLKQVNDKYGHKKGDDYIRQAANVLAEYFQAYETFRISGDEFVVVCEDIEEKQFNDIINNMNDSIENKHNSILAVGSIWTQSTTTVEHLIADAEVNMYKTQKVFYENNPQRSRRRE